MAETIGDDDELYRRLFLTYVKPDGTVSSSAYMTSGQPDHEISVHLARLTTPSEALRVSNRPSFGVGSLVAWIPQRLGFEVVHAPTDIDRSHTLIRGENTKLKCQRLARATTVILAPGGASP